MVIDLKKKLFDFCLRVNKCILFKGRNKKGAMEVDEIIKIAFIIIVLIVMLGGIVVLFSGKGGRLLESVKDMFRFGG